MGVIFIFTFSNTLYLFLASVSPVCCMATEGFVTVMSFKVLFLPSSCHDHCYVKYSELFGVLLFR